MDRLHLAADHGAGRPPDTPPWTLLADDGERATFYAGPAMVELHRTETASYRDNLATGSPSLWVGAP